MCVAEAVPVCCIDPNVIARSVELLYWGMPTVVSGSCTDNLVVPLTLTSLARKKE